MAFQLRSLMGALLLLTLVLPVRATPYWVAWEGDDYPDNQGWERWWGDYNGPFGPGATRTLANGAMTIDSLHDDQIWDFNVYAAPTLPDPGEIFVAEWSVLIDPASDPTDTGVVISGGSAAPGVAFRFGPDGVRITDLGTTIAYAAGEFHSFSFRTADGQSFALWMDGSQVASGPYTPVGLSFPALSFGDGTVGERSRSTWDYVRFGIVPEPNSAVLAIGIAGLALSAARRRSRSRVDTR